jgi:predicted O-methyltransferase YrrM
MDNWVGTSPNFDARVRAVLAEYGERMAREQELYRTLDRSEFARRRDEFLLGVGEATGALMYILAEATGARTILEVGTSYGYSTVWLAAAAREAGGMLHTLELVPEKADYARERIERAGLSAHVTFHVGDAQSLIEALPAPFDFVLIDLWKDLYIPCFDLVYPKLSQGAFVVADNMLEPEAVRPQADAYRAHVRAKPRISSVLLPVGSGIEISRFD